MAVYISKPFYVTGITLSNPSCDDGTYALDFIKTSANLWGDVSFLHSDIRGVGSKYYAFPNGWVFYYNSPHFINGSPSSGVWGSGSTHPGGLIMRTDKLTNAMVYKDYGVDFWSGDFTFYIDDLRLGTWYDWDVPSVGKNEAVFSMSNKLGTIRNYQYGGYEPGEPVTVSIASPCVVTLSPGSYSVQVGMPIYLHTTGALPTGLSADTCYYIITDGFAGTSFRISATPEGPAINTSGTQSGNHSYTICPDTQESDLFGLTYDRKYLCLYVNGVKIDSILTERGWHETGGNWIDGGVGYWLTLIRTEGTPSKFRVNIYSDAARTTLITTASTLGTVGYMEAVLPSDIDYRYIYLFASNYNTAFRASTLQDYGSFSDGLRTLSWGGGTPVNIPTSTTYSLDDGTGNTIDATIDVSSLPTINETDNITICNTPVVTNSPDPISVTKMTANGEVFIAGSSIRGFCYKLSSSTGDPTTANSKVNEAVATAEVYDLDITSLTPLTEYKVRAYIVIDGDTYYGDTELATTLVPIITTSAPTVITSSSCTGNGGITLIGEDLCTRRGFCYMLSATLSETPTVANSVVYDNSATGFSTGTYTKALTGLSSDANYRIRAYMIVGGVIYYGNTVTFKTLPIYHIREFKTHLVANEFNPLRLEDVPKGNYWKDPFIKKVK